MKATALLALLVAGDGVLSTPSTIVKLPAPAVCLDGSPAVYYLSKGTNSTAWLFHHQGGGWCQTLDECARRANGGLGSSKGYPTTKDLRTVDPPPTSGDGSVTTGKLGHNHFERDCSINPLFCQWNFVYMPYCDGQSFAGDAAGGSYEGAQLQFRGKAIREAVVSSLRPGLTAATHSVVTGCSAGGAAAFFHVDWFAEQLPHAMTRGMPDSGVFLDGNYARDGKQNYGARMANMYTMANASAGLPPACVAAKGEKCLFAEHVIPFLKTPLFAINSAYDASMAAGEYLDASGRPAGNLACPEWCAPPPPATGENSTARLFHPGSPTTGLCAAPACVTTMNAFGDYINATLTALLKAPHGMFLHSCYRHCGQLADELGVGNLNPLTAFQHWFESGKLLDGGTQWWQGTPFPCTKCCANQPASSVKTDDHDTTSPRRVELSEDWEEYMRAFGKVYKSADSEEYRRSIFVQNMFEYAALNALEPLARYGPTAFSDKARAEYLGGYHPSGIGAPELEINTSVKVPTARDWTNVYTTPIKDQSSCGGCWAESAIEQVESDAMREHNFTGVLSTQELIDCTQQGQGSWRGGCGGGDPVPGYKVLQRLGGVASGYDYKFEVRDARCRIDNYTKYVKVRDFKSVGKKDEVAMKSFVGSTGPLSVCVDASDWSGYKAGIKTTCGKSTDHCVQLVGYGVEEGVEYWKVRNSWGSSFGENGFIRLKMGKNLCNIADGPTTTTTSVVAPAPVPSPSPCRDQPLNWRSSEGDPCSLYDLNSYCTADGREGPGWETCANGNITKYADSKGVTPLKACCACGGGTAPAPPVPLPPPPPPTSKCVDHPRDWRSSEGDSCCVYPWNSYCTPTGKEGPSWDKSWGKISDYADEDGMSALDACCGCGGGVDRALKSDDGDAALHARSALHTGIPCDGYWLVEESDAGDYSALDVRPLGFHTNRSVCTNADDSLAGKAVSLAHFLNASHAAVITAMNKSLLPHVRGGAATRDLVIQDLESPEGIHPRKYGDLNDTQLAAVVKATKLRLQVARELMPFAGIALYATAVNSSAAAIAGYKRAGKLGLWDLLTHLVPVLYTGPGMHGSGLDSEVTGRLNASIEIMPTNGRLLPLAPVLSWRMFGAGSEANCAVSKANLAIDLADIRKWDAAHPGRIVALQWWSGTDHDTDGKNSSRCNETSEPPMTYIDWLKAADIVPASCLPPQKPAKTDDVATVATRRSAVHPATASAGKQVFAHYMLCFAAFGERGTSANATAGYQKEMAVAQTSGVDGFAIEYLGHDSYYLPSALGMFAACEAYNAALPAGGKPFQLFIIINFCCGLNLTDAVSLYTRFHNSSCAMVLENRPVFSSWSAVDSHLPWQESVQHWVQNFYAPLAKAGLPRPFFLPFIYPANYTGDPNVPHVSGYCAEGTCPESPDLEQQRAIVEGFGSALDGLWYWGCAPPADAVANSSRDTVQACRERGKYVATPVSGPYSPHGKSNNRYTPSHGGRSTINVWTEHIHSQPDMVIFTTWNDLGEHHYVGPYNLQHGRGGIHGYNAFPHLAYLELSAYFIQWYKLPPGSVAPKITEEKVFFFYNLQPVNNSCPGDPEGQGRLVLSDPNFPLEDRLYATMLLNASAQLTLTSGNGAPRSFHATTGVVSFEVPRFHGAQRIKVMRGREVLADITGTELVNKSTDPSVLAHCNHQTFTGVARLVLKTDDSAAIFAAGDKTIFTLLPEFVSYTIDSAALCSKGWTLAPVNIDNMHLRLLTNPAEYPFWRGVR